MSARKSGAAAACRNFDPSEFEVDTRPKPYTGRLAVVWRNPRSNNVVSTGSVRLGELCELYGRPSGTVIFGKSVGDLGNSQCALPGTVTVASGVWGNSQCLGGVYGTTSLSSNSWEGDRPPNGLYATAFLGSKFWEINELQGASPDATLIPADLGGMYTFASCLPKTSPVAVDERPQIGCIELPLERPDDRLAEREFRFAFLRAVDERFEDGMESQFSRELDSLVRKYGAGSIDVLGVLLQDLSISSAVQAEALRWVGRAEGAISHSAGLSLLRTGLSSGSALVRDSAALGMAAMDDPAAIPLLERAVEVERNSELRADMRQVLEELRGS